MAISTAAAPHRFSFFRAGGVDQVRLDSAADVFALDQLDQKLWMALACPVKGIELDERTLALFDSDGDGRVRAPEVLEAIRWLRGVLVRTDGLLAGRDGLEIDAIDPASDAGKRLRAAFGRVRELLGSDATTLTVADVARGLAAAGSAPRNGDGVVPPEALDDAEVRRLATDVIATVGGAPDRSGAQGVDREKLERFFSEAVAFDLWHRDAATRATEVLPLGDATARAAEATAAIRAKVEDYFTRCRIVAFDARAQAALNREESAYLALAARDLSITEDELRALPLAEPEADRSLPLTDRANPAWTVELLDFRRAAVVPLLGRDVDEISADEWRRVDAALAPHDAWRRASGGRLVASLGLPRVRAVLAGPERSALEAAIAEDLAHAGDVADIEQLEKLVRLVRDLMRLLRNFVNFADFYGRSGATFQVGTLYLDGRSHELVVSVEDASKHATLAPMSRAYLVYCDCRDSAGKTRQIAAAVMNGDGDNLFVGRNGLFYDRAGRDWSATITKIVDNPISVRQAFFAPYKKALQFLEDFVAKRAAAADQAADARLQGGVEQVGAAAAAPPAPAAPVRRMDIGVLAAISVAISGVAVIVGSLLQAFFRLGLLMPLGILGIVLLISGPAMAIAWFKLRRRNLGPLLDANGWAVNSLARVNIPLGRSLTRLRRLPPGSHRSLHDPYAEKKSPWPAISMVLVLLAAGVWGYWRTGWLHATWPELTWIPRPKDTRSVTPDAATPDATTPPADDE